MNIDEAIVYSGCVQHFLKVEAEPSFIAVDKYVREHGKNLSEVQIIKVIESAKIALINSKNIVL